MTKKSSSLTEYNLDATIGNIQPGGLLVDEETVTLLDIVSTGARRLRTKEIIDKGKASIFRKAGDLFEIQFKGGRLIKLKDRLGLTYIWYLLKFPNSWFTPTDLTLATLENHTWGDDPRTVYDVTETMLESIRGRHGVDKGMGITLAAGVDKSQPIADEKALVCYKEAVKLLKRELRDSSSRKKEPLPPETEEKKRGQIKVLEGMIANYNDPKKFYKTQLDRTPENIRLSVYGAYKGAMDKLQEEDLNLHKHLFDAISSGGNFIYSSEAPNVKVRRWYLE